MTYIVISVILMLIVMIWVGVIFKNKKYQKSQEIMHHKKISRLKMENGWLDAEIEAKLKLNKALSDRM